MLNRDRPRVFVDADVLLAACASPSEHGASLVILRMAEITLLEAVTSQQVIEEVRRNLVRLLPQAWPAMQTIVARCLVVTPDPTDAELLPYAALAHEVDRPILVAALQAGCRWLVTFNLRHYRPGHPAISVARPGEFLAQARDLFSRLGS